MNVIYIPGFWDSPDKFEVLSTVLAEADIEHKILDYSEYKNFGESLKIETFSQILKPLTDNKFSDSIIISYSMGASFLYDFLAHENIKPAKLIFINPLLENVGNPITSSYYRVLDMHKQGQLSGAINTAHKGLVPLMNVALNQQNYNKKIKFNRKINLEATFVWSEKDLICPISKYEEYKNYFSNSNLVKVPDQHHNWLVYEEPIKKFLLPQIIGK